MLPICDMLLLKNSVSWLPWVRLKTSRYAQSNVLMFLDRNGIQKSRGGPTISHRTNIGFKKWRSQQDSWLPRQTKFDCKGSELKMWSIILRNVCPWAIINHHRWWLSTNVWWIWLFGDACSIETGFHVFCRESDRCWKRIRYVTM